MKRAASQRDARAGEIQRAIQKMRTWDKHHARADRDEPEHGTELDPDGNRADNTGEECGAERLHEQVTACPRQPSAEEGAGAGTERNQDQAERVGGAENHAQPRRLRPRPLRRSARSRRAGIGKSP